MVSHSKNQAPNPSLYDLKMTYQWGKVKVTGKNMALWWSMCGNEEKEEVRMIINKCCFWFSSFYLYSGSKIYFPVITWKENSKHTTMMLYFLKAHTTLLPCSLPTLWKEILKCVHFFWLVPFLLFLLRRNLGNLYTQWVVLTGSSIILLEFPLYYILFQGLVLSQRVHLCPFWT